MSAPSSILASALACLLATPVAAGCQRDDFNVVIDIGHSKELPGTISARGKPEFEFNREVAMLLRSALRQAGFVDASAIEHEPSTPTLEERADIAAERGADLLVSVHHDSVQPRYLKDWRIGGEDLQYTDAFQGYSVFFSRRNADPESSEAFARLLGLSMLRHGFTPTLHHAEPIKGENRELADAATGVYFFDDLVVLRTADMPAVLFEVGVIKNRQEEVFLLDSAFRDRMLDAVVYAIDAFCSTLSETAK